MSDFHVSHVSPPWSGAGQMVRPPGVKPSRVGLSLVRRDQCEYGEGRRRIGHEHPAPGFALLPAVFAAKVERVCPPRVMHRLIDLAVLLMSPEPLRPCPHRRMLDRNAGCRAPVPDQPPPVRLR